MDEDGRESLADRRDEEMRRFLLNFAKGDYDGEIGSSLDPVPVCNGWFSSDEEGRRDNWEERKELALESLKTCLQEKYCIKQEKHRINISPEEFCITEHCCPTGLSIEPWDDVGAWPWDDLTRPPPVRHDQSLTPLWIQLFDELEKVCGSGNLGVLISDVELAQDFFEMLARSFKGKVENLDLKNNSLCKEAFAMLSTFVEDSPSLVSLSLSHNSIGDLDAVIRLTVALKTNPNMRHLYLARMNIGSNVDVLSAVLQSDVELISLGGNNIGSPGAAVIAGYLETNPPIEQLYLYSNEFNDDDAILFARALRTNTNLRSMCIVENNFTFSGAKTMLTAVFDSSSLNAIWESNHKCELDLFPGPFSSVPYQMQDLNENFGIGRTGKMLIALRARETLLQYLEDGPVELMPDVLAFIQKEEDQEKLANMIYGTMRWWHMPLLYAYHGHASSNNRKRKMDCFE